MRHPLWVRFHLSLWHIHRRWCEKSPSQFWSVDNTWLGQEAHIQKPLLWKFRIPLPLLITTLSRNGWPSTSLDAHRRALISNLDDVRIDNWSPVEKSTFQQFRQRKHIRLRMYSAIPSSQQHTYTLPLRLKANTTPRKNIENPARVLSPVSVSASLSFYHSLSYIDEPLYSLLLTNLALLVRVYMPQSSF